jgi:hypothetical protein
MDEKTKELLDQMLLEIKEIKEKVERIEKNQAQVANAEHKNWHMLADKLFEYDKILHKIFGKKTENK